MSVSSLRRCGVVVVAVAAASLASATAASAAPVKWAAVAYSSDESFVLAVWDYPTLEDARIAAMHTCVLRTGSPAGLGDCDVALDVHIHSGECVGVAQGDNGGYGIAVGDDLASADASAIGIVTEFPATIVLSGCQS